MANSADSTTVPRWFVHYPTDSHLSRVLTHQLLGAMTDPEQRRSAATALAKHVGAETLIVFLLDPDVLMYLPAPGFVQTLPDRRSWTNFLARCTAQGEAHAVLAYPGYADLQPVSGVDDERGAILVLVGGVPHDDGVAVLRLLLPLLAAAFRGERAVLAAQAQAEIARRSALEARQLAEGLDAARRDLNRLYGEVRIALQARDEFLAAVTHDLNTPLTAIRGHTQLLHRLNASDE